MVQLLINGVEQPLPPARSYGEILEHVLKNYVTASAWIGSVLLDGQVLPNWDEEGVRAIPATQVQSMDFRLIHPDKLANETFETLILFTDHITLVSRRVAEAIRGGQNPMADFQRLLDDLETFNASFNGAKEILCKQLPGGQLPSDIQFVEADFLSILEETLNYAKSAQYDYMGEMLETHLPENMTEWRESALPRLMG